MSLFFIYLYFIVALILMLIGKMYRTDIGTLWSQSTYRGRVEIGEVFQPLSAGAYTTTLCVMLDIVKRMERTPESGRCLSVCTLWYWVW